MPTRSNALSGQPNQIKARRIAAGLPVASSLVIASLVTTSALKTSAAHADVDINPIVADLPVVQPDDALLAALQQQPLNPHALYLRTGLIDTSKPDANLPPLRDLAGPAAGGRNFIIQLDGPMNPARRAQLLAAGVRIGDYLPVNAFIVRLDDAKPDDLAKLAFIRHHREYTTDLKLDPELARRGFINQDRQALAAAGRSLVEVTLFFDKAPGTTRNDINKIPGAAVLQQYEAGASINLVVEMNTADLPRLANLNDVMYVQDAPDITTRNNNSRWVVQSATPGQTPLYDNGIRGEGQIVGVIDSFLKLDHCAFIDIVPPGPTHRKILAYNVSPNQSDHGTHVSGTVAGNAGEDTNNRGVAYNAKIVFNTIPWPFSEANILDHLNLHHSQGARIHTNSWGDDGTTAYNGLARGFDVFAWENEDSLPLLAVTNASNLRNPENAKNLLACGATQPVPNIDSHCSGGVGPTTDGRRKPEIYAPGCNIVSTVPSSACATASRSGTSMATPAIAGAAALARQYFTEGFYPSRQANPVDAFTPSAALLKAVLLNSTADMTNVAGFPSNLEGWGRLTLDNTLAFPGDTRSLAVHDAFRNPDGLSTGQSFELPLEVTNNAEPLRITLVWTDAPGAVNTSFAPVNDLNLVVISPTGDTYLGNVFLGGSSVTGGTPDDRNNVEQVLITTPQPGTWTIRIDAAAVNVEQQGFAVVASGSVEPFATTAQILIAQPPTTATFGQDISFTVLLNPRDEQIVPDSQTFYYREDPVGPFSQIPLTPTGQPFEYTATISAPPCGQTIQYFASAQSIPTGVITSPNNAPTLTYELQVVATPDIIAELDMQTDDGWTIGDPTDTATTGIWILGQPIGTFSGGTPVAPGQAFSQTSTNAWVTGLHTPGQGVGFNDIDNGKTTLYSPVFDLDGAATATISYARWFYNSMPTTTDSDVLLVEVTSDGNDWVTLERYGEVGSERTGGWNLAEFNLHDYITLTSTVQLRFVAMDEDPQGLNEAAIDMLTIAILDCPQTPPVCPCDIDNDGTVTVADYFEYLTLFFEQLGGPGTADLDNDGTVTVADYFEFLACFFVAFPNTCP